MPDDTELHSEEDYEQQIYYTPSGKWASMANKAIEGLTLGGQIHPATSKQELYEPEIYFAKGLASGKLVPLVSRKYDIWRFWQGFHTEMYLMSSSEHLRPLQGSFVPSIVSVQSIPGGYLTVNTEVLNRKGWNEAHPKSTPTKSKKRIIEAYVKIHSQGVLHGSVDLSNINVDANGNVHILNFRSSRALNSCIEAGLHPCTQEEIEFEMRHVKFMIDFKDSQKKEKEIWNSDGPEGSAAWRRGTEALRSESSIVNSSPHAVWDSQDGGWRIFDIRDTWFAKKKPLPPARCHIPSPSFYDDCLPDEPIDTLPQLIEADARLHQDGRQTLTRSDGSLALTSQSSPRRPPSSSRLRASSRGMTLARALGSNQPWPVRVPVTTAPPGTLSPPIALSDEDDSTMTQRASALNPSSSRPPRSGNPKRGDDIERKAESLLGWAARHGNILEPQIQLGPDPSISHLISPPGDETVEQKKRRLAELDFAIALQSQEAETVVNSSGFYHQLALLGATVLARHTQQPNHVAHSKAPHATASASTAGTHADHHIPDPYYSSFYIPSRSTNSLPESSPAQQIQSPLPLDYRSRSVNSNEDKLAAPLPPTPTPQNIASGSTDGRRVRFTESVEMRYDAQMANGGPRGPLTRARSRSPSNNASNGRRAVRFITPAPFSRPDSAFAAAGETIRNAHASTSSPSSVQGLRPRAVPSMILPRSQTPDNSFSLMTPPSPTVAEYGDAEEDLPKRSFAKNVNNILNRRLIERGLVVSDALGPRPADGSLESGSSTAKKVVRAFLSEASADAGPLSFSSPTPSSKRLSPPLLTTAAVGRRAIDEGQDEAGDMEEEAEVLALLASIGALDHLWHDSTFIKPGTCTRDPESHPSLSVDTSTSISPSKRKRVNPDEDNVDVEALGSPSKRAKSLDEA